MIYLKAIIKLPLYLFMRILLAISYIIPRQRNIWIFGSFGGSFNDNTKFGLMFGTLLGAVRENSFIKHDEDVDLFVLEEDKEKLFNCIHDFINIGFQIFIKNKKL